MSLRSRWRENHGHEIAECFRRRLEIAERLARGLGEAGFAIVSGIARGIDGAVHRASLATGTVAVLAGGADRIHPPEHARLAEEIAAQGAIVSEMPIGYVPRAHDFPRRNRLISGLALGVVVIEAARRSGSLITARSALEQGRDPRCRGPAARPARRGQQLAAQSRAPRWSPKRPTWLPCCSRSSGALDLGAGEPERAPPSPDGDPQAGECSRITALLGPHPLSLIDDLVRLSGAPAIVHAVLLELDLAGRPEAAWRRPCFDEMSGVLPAWAVAR